MEIASSEIVSQFATHSRFFLFFFFNFRSILVSAPFSVIATSGHASSAGVAICSADVELPNAAVFDADLDHLPETEITEKPNEASQPHKRIDLAKMRKCAFLWMSCKSVKTTFRRNQQTKEIGKIEETIIQRY